MDKKYLVAVMYITEHPGDTLVSTPEVSILTNLEMIPEYAKSEGFPYPSHSPSKTFGPYTCFEFEREEKDPRSCRILHINVCNYPLDDIIKLRERMDSNE